MKQTLYHNFEAVSLLLTLREPKMKLNTNGGMWPFKKALKEGRMSALFHSALGGCTFDMPSRIARRMTGGMIRGRSISSWSIVIFDAVGISRGGGTLKSSLGNCTCTYSFVSLSQISYCTEYSNVKWFYIFKIHIIYVIFANYIMILLQLIL